MTGGAGFLGSHLCARLIDAGHRVTCVDNFSTGRRAAVAHLMDHRRFELMDHDVTNPLNVVVDEIYNLACPASPAHYQLDPIQTLKTAVLGAINMLELARLLRVKILQASTSEIYGDPQIHPQTEGYWGNVNPVGPRSCYNEGKRCAETLFYDYHRQYALPIKIIRIFNTYGPGMRPDDGRVVSNFIIQALKGEPITVFGDGTQTRSFCYVDDMVDGMIRLMSSSDSVTGPLNFGNPDEVSILSLAREIVTITGSTSEIVFTRKPIDDPTLRRPDIAAARDQIGWQPAVGMEEGLTRTISYFVTMVAGMRSARVTEA
ncbi:MAG: UDP-glucuronic acid decarboxylase family protein [Pseudomonadota bacterium]